MAQSEETLDEIHANLLGKFGWLIGIGVPFALISFGAWMVEGGEPVGYFLIGLAIWQFVNMGPFFHAGKQYLIVTTRRAYGEAEHDLFGRATAFSVPLGDLESVKQSWSAIEIKIKIKIRGARKPIKLVLMEEDEKLAELVHVSNSSNSEIREECERRGIDFSAGQVRVDRPGPGARIALLGLAGILVAVLVADVILVGAPMERYGGETPCITLARVYRDNSSEGVQTLLERLGQDPSRQFNRVIASRIIGGIIQNAFPDDAFTSQSDLQCLYRLALYSIDNTVAATHIADMLEAEVGRLLSGN